MEDSIRKCLSEHWEENSLGSSESPITSFDDYVALMDSMTAVMALIKLEEIVGQPIPQCVIKKGGYDSPDDFIDSLTEAVLKHIGQHHD